MKLLVRNLLRHVYNKHVSNRKNKGLKYPFNQKLSSEEYNELKLYWGDNLSSSRLVAYEFYKAFGVFDPRLMPNDIYAEAERLLNPFRYSLFAQHKCLLKYFIPAEHRPQTIVQNIDGHYFDYNDNPISEKEAISIAEAAIPFMIKIAAGSGGGRGIQKIIDSKKVATVFEEYHKDFICQKVLKEHETLKRFNPECINTIRVLSLNINNKCSVLSSFVRMGGIGSIVDNLHSSQGRGALSGITPNGRLHSFGIDKNYNVTKTSPMNQPFNGMSIEYYDKIIEFITNCHQKNLPFANLIGWDVIIDENSKPIVIEINLDSADIAAHQIFNGPIFGERTNEVLEYMKNNPQKVIIKI